LAIESRILDLLDSWRDLPAYQLERRADIFFAAYLPRFLANKFCTPISELLIPEFPLHHRTIRPDVERKKDDSCRLDYLALSLDLSNAYFVELKIDPGSRGRDQEANMAAAKAVGFRALISGLLKIVEANTKPESKDSYLPKYCCLLRLLARNNVLVLPEELEEALCSIRFKTAVKACLPRVRVNDINPNIHVLYLQPPNGRPLDGDIDFCEFADFLPSLHDDPLAFRFAASLRRWAACPARR